MLGGFDLRIPRFDLRILLVVANRVDGGVFGVEGDMPELGSCCGSARR
jgi:hypothetical protein